MVPLIVANEHASVYVPVKRLGITDLRALFASVPAGSLRGLSEIPLQELIKIMGSVTSGRKLREWLDAVTPIAR